MSIYHGSAKIENIYVGSVKIGQVYKGSTLVYESAKKIPLYGYADNNFLLGSNSMSGVVVSGVLDTITALTGTLGESGSKVTVSSSDENVNGMQFTYYDTLTFSGVNLHIYANIILSGHAFWAVYILEDAAIGSNCLHWAGTTFYPDDTSHIRYYPNYVTSTEMRYANTGSGFARAAANDTNYTKKGFRN